MTPRLLLVDDDSRLASMVGDYLGRAGFEVETAGSLAGGRALRQRAMQAFTAPTLDAGAVEQLRQQMVQQHDQMSRRTTQAMLDIARVLTPEQRTRLGERMRDRQARMEDRMKRMESMRQGMPPRR